jgi:hypothetical protein
VPASFPEKSNEQIGRSVHNQRMLVELRGGVHETAEAQALPGTAQIAAAGYIQLGNDIEQGKPGGFLTLFQCEFTPHSALIAKLIAPQRALNADEQSASLFERNVIPHRSRQGRHRHPQLLKARLNVTHSFGVIVQLFMTSLQKMDNAAAGRRVRLPAREPTGIDPAAQGGVHLGRSYARRE